MVGELLVIIAMKTSLGAQLEFARKFSASPMLLATMLVIFVLGMVVELRTKRGLILN